MNIFQLVFKQMRQRALGTWLTILSVMLGAALAVSILVLSREIKDFFGQRSFGYDSLIGIKGSPIDLVMSTIYHIGVSPGNIAYSNYLEMVDKNGKYYSEVKNAVPFVLGDTVDGKFPIIGTITDLFGFDSDGKPLQDPDKVLAYANDPDRGPLRYDLAEGRVFRPDHLEAIFGSEAARRSGYKIGDLILATHSAARVGIPADVHPEKWQVVGVLKPTHTANDYVVWIPIRTFFCISAHGPALIQQEYLRKGVSPSPGAGMSLASDAITVDKQGNEHHMNYIKHPDGSIELTPEIAQAMALSGIMVQSRGEVAFQRLQYAVNNGPEMMDVNPAGVVRDFLKIFLDPLETTLGVIAILVQVLAAAGIMVSIYNSVSAKIREVAILRALGATRTRILAMICLEAGVVGLIGGVAGAVLGHLICLVASRIMAELFGHGIAWFKPDVWEGVYLVALVAVAVLAGLVPAMKAYQTPVATNLVAV